MRASGTRWLPLVLLTLLAALTFWLDQTTNQAEQRNDGKGRHDPDFMVDSFTVRRYDVDGRLQHLLSAKKMLHYADDDSTEVNDPALRYFSNDRRTDVTAPRAWVGPEGKELRLSDGVRVLQAATASEPATLLTTNELLVFPDEEIARSNVPVTITQGSSVVSGSGLEADNKIRLYKLQGRAHATITRQKLAKP